MLKIGITERGDAGLDLSWAAKLNKFDAAVLITKNITDEFIETVMPFKNKIILHATCTGMGGSRIEPNVPDYKTQLSQVQKLINKGFPEKQITIRIDPIVPVKSGLELAQAVIDASPVKRFRFSVLDAYPHVRQRFIANNITPPYGNNFQPPDYMFDNMRKWLLSQPSDYIFESCAEPKLANIAPNIIATGCVSKKDLDILNIAIPDDQLEIAGRQRNTCLCITGKTELLNNKARCPHQCLYCFWKD